jgi:oxygen-dependent protoporphyrinogen oxidase
MIGKLNVKTPEVTVVGAGISGLLAAYELDKRGFRVTVIEANKRSGGLVRTDRNRFGMAEAAANSLLGSPAVLKLCAELEVELVPVRKESRARYILRGGRMRKFPLSIGETAGAFARAAFARAGNHADVLDLKTWGTRHLGSNAVDYLLTPFVRGIYGVQPQELGLLAAFPSLFVPSGQTLLGTMLKKRFTNTGKKAKSAGMVAPKSGMSELVVKLERRLEERLGERFIKGVTVREIPEAANVVLTVPAYSAASFFSKEFPALARKLERVEYTPLVSATAFVECKSLAEPVKGVGVLLPANENRNCLGVLFSSSSFPDRVVDQNRFASFTMMIGGSAKPEWAEATDEQIKLLVQQELNAIVGLRGEVAELVINRWPRAIPRYSTDLPRAWQTARETWCATPGRILFGNYTGQVSMRGMIEAVATM